MRVVFVSNYLNHHQIPFSNAMYRELDGDYYFVQTEPMENERLNMGWNLDEDRYPYLIKSYENRDVCMHLINESDVVITGSAPQEYIEERLKKGKLTFRCSERIYKRGQWRAFSPRGIYYMYKAHAEAEKKNMYMLCASAYTACDLSLFKYYRNRMLQWGYFPQNYEYNVKELLKKKRENNKIEIVWCGRFIKWKHPEYVIELAHYLRKENLIEQVHITMIGVGELRKKYESIIIEDRLEKYITIIGPLSPDEVREQMIMSNIFLATSDYNEGWGAVINEAMNSACTVIASHAMGATPFLIDHKYNGVIYKNGNMNDFLRKVEWVITCPDQAEVMGAYAYDTINNVWNADNAAEQLLSFVKSIAGNTSIQNSDAGPCSKAEIIPQARMYNYLVKKSEHNRYRRSDIV